MKIKDKINEDFIKSFKAKNFIRKDILGMLKTKITEAEKKDGKELTDDQVFNVINSALKQVEQTIVATQGNTESTVYKEAVQEKEILLTFLPSQMTDVEIEDEIDSILVDMIFPADQKNRAVGSIMKHFKERFNGQYNSGTLKSIVDRKLA